MFMIKLLNIVWILSYSCFCLSTDRRTQIKTCKLHFVRWRWICLSRVNWGINFVTALTIPLSRFQTYTKLNHSSVVRVCTKWLDMRQYGTEWAYALWHVRCLCISRVCISHPFGSSIICTNGNSFINSKN